MKYIKSFTRNVQTKFQINENYSDRLESDIKHMLLSLSDDDLKIFFNSPIQIHNEISIKISGYIKDSDNGDSIWKSFFVNDYIDEIERIIDYLKEKDYKLIKCEGHEVERDLKILIIEKGDDYSWFFEEDNIEAIKGKTCVTLTLFFNKL